MYLHDKIPSNIIAAAVEVGEWMDNHGYQSWRIGPCADRAVADAMEERIAELEAKYSAIQTGYLELADKYTHAIHNLAAEQATIAQMREALRDMLSGWRYIRETHGDLYGVGWDRSQLKVEEALALQSDRAALDKERAEARKAGMLAAAGITDARMGPANSMSKAIRQAAERSE